jgi:hypothetical protein
MRRKRTKYGHMWLCSVVIREASHKARGYGFKSRGGFAPSQWVLHNLFISIILARRRRSFRTFGQAQATCRRGPRRLQVELPSPTAVGPTAAGCHDARRLVIKSEKISNGRIILQNLYYKERTQLKTFLTQFGLILPLTPDPPVVCFWKWIKWKDYKVQKNRNLESVSAKNEFFLTHITLPTHVPSSGPPGHTPAPRAYVKKLIRSLLFFFFPRRPLESGSTLPAACRYSPSSSSTSPRAAPRHRLHHPAPRWLVTSPTLPSAPRTAHDFPKIHELVGRRPASSSPTRPTSILVELPHQAPVHWAHVRRRSRCPYRSQPIPTSLHRLPLASPDPFKCRFYWSRDQQGHHGCDGSGRGRRG